eukprot:SAG31_NODE_3006_length_4794_cov_3.365495_2_plen_66_part_00
MCVDTADPEWVFICQHPLHRVIRCKLGSVPAGSRLCDHPELWTVIADSTKAGLSLNSPNDVVVGR